MELAKNNLDNEVYALTSVTVEPSEEDLKIWHQAYLEDLSTKTVFQQLRQGANDKRTQSDFPWSGGSATRRCPERSWFLSPCGNKS